MATKRYVCKKCDRIREFDTRRKNIICPVCNSDLGFSPLWTSKVVGGVLYKGEFSFSEKKLQIPEGAADIEWGAFKGNWSIEEIIFPKTLENISPYCFSENKKLKELFIPGNIRGIGVCAFKDCSSLERITIGEGVKEISLSAFSGCPRLKSVILPTTLKKIGAHSFSACTSLESIIIPEGVQEIEERAFSDCCNLKCVSLPRSLKRIGENAFYTQSYKQYAFGQQVSETQTVRIVLPDAIEEIGVNAFGQIVKGVCYFVSKGSVAEKYAKNGDASIVYADVMQGVLTGTPQIDKTLYYVENANKKYTIPKGVETIAEYAFYGCFGIEELVIPASVKEICAHAFSGTEKLLAVTFEPESNLTYIGSKAFDAFCGTIVDLPPSVEEIAPDAFPKNCIVSIGGEMPLYSQFVSSIMRKEAVISSKGNEWSILKTKLEENHNKLQAHLAACPNQTKEISSLNEELVIVSKDREDETGLLNLEGNELRKVISDTESQIRYLIHERKSCFFLSFSKKRELDEKISNKKNDLQLQKNALSELISRMDKTEAEFLSKINRIKEKINSLLRIKDDWKTKNDQLISERNQIEKDKLSLEQDISSLKEETEKEKASLQSKHKKWLNERNAEIQRIEKQKQAEADLREKKRMEEEERKRKEALTTERKRLLKGLVAPECNKIPTYWFSSRGNIIEETALNDSFLRLINATNEKEQANVLSRFVSLHANKIDRVKEINLALGLHIEDGIAQLRQVDAFHISEHCLPERFEKLVKRFASLKQWEQFKQDACEIIQPKRKNSKNNIQDKFFSGTDYFAMAHESISLLIFPYCMVMYQVGKPLSLYTYNDLKIDVEFIDKEEVTESISDFGELVKEQHMYLNKDGSVSRRYSYNPVVKTIRYTTMTITKNVTNEDVFTFPVKAYQDAMNLKRIFETFSRAITTDLMEKVYGLILHSANLEDIEASIDNLAKEEAIRLEILAKKEAEEKQRLEEERKAAILAAEAKRQEIIQRQRELNEERRRLEEEKKKSLQLFEDDFSVIENDNVEEDIDNIDIYFSVIGSMVISNNVFKVVVKQEGKLNAKEYAVSFVSEEDNVISNKKKIIAGDIGCETTLGFVLDSGIDYTKMKKCFMNIETADGVIQRVEFKMNISFYSDF